MKLYFGKEKNKELLFQPKTKNAAWKYIEHFLDERNYRHYYYQITKLSDHVTMIDFGSWSQFFWLED